MALGEKNGTSGVGLQWVEVRLWVPVVVAVMDTTTFMSMVAVLVVVLFCVRVYKHGSSSGCGVAVHTATITSFGQHCSCGSQTVSRYWHSCGQVLSCQSCGQILSKLQ